MSEASPYLFLIDARRGDVDSLKSSLAKIPRGCGVWVLSEEELLTTKRISRWFTSEQIPFLAIDLKTEGARHPVVLVASGATDFPTSGDLDGCRYREVDTAEGNVWRGWAYVPESQLALWPVATVRKLIQGIVEKEKDPDTRTIDPKTLSKKRILFIGHTNIQGPVGGVQLHVRDMIRHLMKDHLVFYLCPDPTGFLIRAFDSNGNYETTYDFEWGNCDQLTNPRAESAFRKFIDRVKPDVIHFHHLLGFPFSLVEIAKSRARTVVSLHDFYSLCPRHDLIDSTGEFCDFCKKESSCTKIKPFEGYTLVPLNVSAAERRRRIRTILAGVTKIVPSSNTKRLLVEHMQFKPHEVVVREYPIAEQQASGRIATMKKRKKGEITIGFIGAFAHKKGAVYFDRLVRAFAKNRPHLKWKVFGELSESDLVLSLEEDFDVEFFGSYAREELQPLLRKEGVDLGLILSIWPETYAMTVAEATAAGCIPVVTDVGAPPERITSLGQGWVLRRDRLEEDFGAILDQLEKFPELLERPDLKALPNQFDSRMQALIETVFETPSSPTARDRANRASGRMDRRASAESAQLRN